jgi:hypothetical protein
MSLYIRLEFPAVSLDFAICRNHKQSIMTSVCRAQNLNDLTPQRHIQTTQSNDISSMHELWSPNTAAALTKFTHN